MEIRTYLLRVCRQGSASGCAASAAAPAAPAGARTSCFWTSCLFTSLAQVSIISLLYALLENNDIWQSRPMLHPRGGGAWLRDVKCAGSEGELLYSSAAVHGGAGRETRGYEQSRAATELSAPIRSRVYYTSRTRTNCLAPTADTAASGAFAPTLFIVVVRLLEKNMSILLLFIHVWLCGQCTHIFYSFNIHIHTNKTYFLIKLH